MIGDGRKVRLRPRPGHGIGNKLRWLRFAVLRFMASNKRPAVGLCVMIIGRRGVFAFPREGGCRLDRARFAVPPTSAAALAAATALARTVLGACYRFACCWRRRVALFAVDRFGQSCRTAG